MRQGGESVTSVECLCILNDAHATVHTVGADFVGRGLLIDQILIEHAEGIVHLAPDSFVECTCFGGRKVAEAFNVEVGETASESIEVVSGRF